MAELQIELCDKLHEQNILKFFKGNLSQVFFIFLLAEMGGENRLTSKGNSYEWKN